MNVNNFVLKTNSEAKYKNGVHYKPPPEVTNMNNLMSAFPDFKKVSFHCTIFSFFEVFYFILFIFLITALKILLCIPPGFSFRDFFPLCIHTLPSVLQLVFI